MSGEKAKGEVKKSKLWDNTYPLSAHPHPDESTTPNLCHPTIIHKKNTMDTEFLVQMRQSNKCGSVRNHEIFNLHFGSGEGPGVSIPCLLQDTSHIYWFHPPQTVNQKKGKMIFNFQEMLLHCLGLCTQNPELRQVDLELTPKRGSHKINMLK